MAAFLTQQQLREWIDRLAAIERPSASHGEAEAAELIAAALRDAGGETTVEREPAHGTYWWPVGLLCGAAAAAALVGRRAAATAVGAFATAAMVDDITGGRQWFRRRFLPLRETTNVVARFGPPGAARTFVVIAHHDAAHSGLVFHPDLPRALIRRFPALGRADTTPGTMWGAVAGPALIALWGLTGLRAARAAGLFAALGNGAAMADIGRRGVVPGANDNLSGVAALLSLARSLQADPPPDTRVILLSTGSEESFMEGMQGFARRHFDSLPRDSTTFVCLDTVGSPHLAALEGEGMVWMNEYSKGTLADLHAAAGELGVELRQGLRFRNATDGLIPLRAGYPTVMIGSIDEYKLPSNYHWPTDTPDRVDYDSVAAATRVVDALIRRSAQRS